MIKELNEVLVAMGDNNELMYVKGQLKNIQKKQKENGDIYYLADIRIPRSVTTDIYATSFNMINVCFSCDHVKANNINDAHMLQFKNNEVFAQLTMLSSVRSNTKDNSMYKFNSTQFYVEDIMLVRQVERPEFQKKAINL